MKEADLARRSEAAAIGHFYLFLPEAEHADQTLAVPSSTKELKIDWQAIYLVEQFESLT